MSKIAIARHQENITINPLEYVLDANKEIMLFNDVEAAKKFLTDNEVNPEDLDSFIYKEMVG